MRVRKPPYSDVSAMDAKLCEFERNLPFSIRCRAALMAMPSRYPGVEAAIEASPEPSKRAMTMSFQVSLSTMSAYQIYFSRQSANESHNQHLRNDHQPTSALLCQSAVRCCRYWC